MSFESVNLSRSSTQPIRELQELLRLIWKDKFIVLFFIVLAVMIAILFNLTEDERWSAKAQVIQPDFYNYSEYQTQVKQFQPLFEKGNRSTPFGVSVDLDGLTQPDILFGKFIEEFNSYTNRKNFIEDNVGVEGIELIKIENIRAFPANIRNERQSYYLSVTSINDEISLKFLYDYIEYTNIKLVSKAYDELRSLIKYKLAGSLKYKELLESQAIILKNIETEKLAKALEIAEELKIDRPLVNVNFGSDSIPVFRGAEVLKREIRINNENNNLGWYSQGLNQIYADINVLEKSQLRKDNSSYFYSYVSEPHSLPKKDNTAILNLLLMSLLSGSLLGVFMVVLKALVFDKRLSI